MSEKTTDPLTRILGELLEGDFEPFRAELDTALSPMKEYLTPLERQMYGGGKKIRPAVMFLAARMRHGTPPLSAKMIKGSVSLEMLHVATLIHDDIVDDALVRRGLPSIASARGEKLALLIGDLQFVQAIRGFADTVETGRDMSLVKLVLDTAFNLCCGELDEMTADGAGTLKERLAHYFKTIDRKTAVLFGLACEAGLALAGAPRHEARRGGFFGRRLGRAFQIMDDLLDIVHDEQAAGKTPGTDLLQRRWSLPVIYAVEELGEDHILSRAMIHGEPLDDLALTQCLSDLRHSQAFEQAYAAARSAALESLFYLECFPRSRYREALEQLALHVVDRSFQRRGESLS